MEPKGLLPYSKSSPPVPILSQMYPVHTLNPIYLKYILLYFRLCLGLPVGLFHSGFSSQNFVCIYSMRVTYPSRLMLLCLIVLMYVEEE